MPALTVELTEEAIRTTQARLRRVERDVADVQKTLELGKRYFAVSSFYRLKQEESWVDDQHLMVESPLSDQDRISMLRIIKRLSEEAEALQEEMETQKQSQAIL